MTTPAAGEMPATDAPGVPEVLPLTKQEQDQYLKSLDKLIGDRVAGIVERNLGNRGDLLDQQEERKQKALAAALTYSEATKNVPVMGALFRTLMTEGSARRGLTGENVADQVSDRFEKLVGSELSKTINLAAADEGGLLVEGTTLELWLEPLRAASVVLSLNPEIIPVTGEFLKVTGFETDPTITWVDEENASPLSTTPKTGERESAMRKAMGLIPITKDFRESAVPQILRRIEDLMRNAFRVGFDLRYITGTGLGKTVKGLRNWITATGASAGQGLANVLTDAETAVNAVETTNIMAERIGIIMNPRSKNHLKFGALDADNKPFFYNEILRGTWLGYPYRTTTNIPANLGAGSNESYTIFQAFNQFFIGQGTSLEMNWYPNASYTEAGNLVSSIERDTEILVGRQKTGTLMPRTTSGYVTTGVLWGT